MVLKYKQEVTGIQAVAKAKGVDKVTQGEYERDRKSRANNRSWIIPAVKETDKKKVREDEN